jgi:hypothetical protein
MPSFYLAPLLALHLAFTILRVRASALPHSRYTPGPAHLVHDP